MSWLGRCLTLLVAVSWIALIANGAYAIPGFTSDDDGFRGEVERAHSGISGDVANGGGAERGRGPGSSIYDVSRELGVDSRFDCSDDPGGEGNCNLVSGACMAFDVAANLQETVVDGYKFVENVRVNARLNKEELLGFDCQAVNINGSTGVAPVVIEVTLRDFAAMPVEPLEASAGPTDGWLPVNMVNVLHASAESQTLDTELLGAPVSVRAIPVSYHWDLGDGNTITTKTPGEAYPSEEVSATYVGEGWYEVTLTTTFSGQFSVSGGEWQDIEGTIEVASESIPIYSKSLESRLVNSDVPIDEDADPWIPKRSPDTEGPQDPNASHREI